MATTQQHDLTMKLCPECGGRTQFFDTHEDEPAFRRCVRCPWFKEA